MLEYFKMRLKYPFLFLLMTFYGLGFSQESELTPLSKISVLTCGAGEDLYTSFGHSAFRVQDPTLGIDVVYNYGTFEFNVPWFYVDFAQGKLIYSLSKANMDRFLSEYKYYNRWVKEQELNLTVTEKNQLYKFLENNNLPENQKYRYDFFYDNCATKIWDVLGEVFGDKLVLDENYIEEQYTFRELIHQNLDDNSWAAFGIDLALGSVIDKKASPKEHMFLPLYIMRQLEHATLASEPLASKTSSLYEPVAKPKSTNFLTSPLFWLWFLFIIVVVINFRDFRNNTRSRWLDFLLFFTTGAAGLQLFFLWFFTDHTTTADNFNILWAFPLNFFVAFVVAKKIGPTWVSKYTLFLKILLLATLIVWWSNLQVFSPLFIPVWLTLGARYLFLYWSYLKPKIT